MMMSSISGETHPQLLHQPSIAGSDVVVVAVAGTDDVAAAAEGVEDDTPETPQSPVV